MDSKYIILTPVYNDWKNLSKLLSKINSLFKYRLGKKFCLVIVDDCSTQNFNVKRLKLSQIEKIKLISLKNNLGSQRALAIGIRYIFSNFKYKFRLIIMDSDGQDNPNGILKIINTANKEKNFSIVVNRGQRSEALWFKICYEIYSNFILVFSFKKIRFGNFSLILSEHIRKLFQNFDLWCALPPVVSLKIKSIKFITLKREKRYSGDSKMNFFGLIYHALRVFSALRTRIVVSSFFFIFLISTIFLKNFEKISLILIFLIIVLNLSNFFLSYKNKKNFLKNYKKIEVKKV